MYGFYIWIESEVVMNALAKVASEREQSVEVVIGEIVFDKLNEIGLIPDGKKLPVDQYLRQIGNSELPGID